MQISLLGTQSQYGSILQDPLFPRLGRTGATGEAPAIGEGGWACSRSTGEFHAAGAGGETAAGPARHRPGVRGQGGVQFRDHECAARSSADGCHTAPDLRLGKCSEGSRRIGVLARFRRFCRDGVASRQQVHAALIAKTQAERLIGHVGRDSTGDRGARAAGKDHAETAEREPQKAARAKAPRPRRRGKKAREQARIQRQVIMTLPAMLAELPRHCAIGCQDQ